MGEAKSTRRLDGYEIYRHRRRRCSFSGFSRASDFGAIPNDPILRRLAFPGLGRLSAARLGLGMLLLAATGVTQAQYEAEPWAASLTSSSASVTGGLLNGYDRDEGTTGTLSSTEFVYEDTTYTVRRFGQINSTLVLRLRPSMDTSVRRNLTAIKVDSTTYAFSDATHTTVGTGDDETSQFAWSNNLPSTTTQSGNSRLRLVAQQSLPSLATGEEVRLRTTMTVEYDWGHVDSLAGLPRSFFRGFHYGYSIGSMDRSYFRFKARYADADGGVGLVGIYRPSQNSGTRTLMLDVYMGEEAVVVDHKVRPVGNILRRDGRWSLYVGGRVYRINDATYDEYYAAAETNDDMGPAVHRYLWTETSSLRMPDLSPSGRRVQVVLTRQPNSSRQVAAEPLTADFRGLPTTHNGTPFTFEVEFSDTVSTTPAELRDAFTVTGATVTSATLKQVAGTAYSGDRVWAIAVTPSGTGNVEVQLSSTTNCSDTDAVCTADGRGLSVSWLAQVAFAPWLTVADATVNEEENATMDFVVTLTPAVNQTVTVDYATSDGTATAPADYTTTSGTLTFAPNETTKTVSVPVINDNVPDNNETFTLTLNNPSVAAIADAEATGTIYNTETDTDIELTASFSNVPTSHDGPGNIFTFRLDFSEDVAGLSFATLRDAFTVENGTVVGAKRRTKGGNRNWEIKVEPTGEATVNITLATGAVETGGGRPLASQLSATVPASALTARWSSAPSVGHNGSSEFGVEIKFTWPVAVSVDSMRDEVLTVTEGTVTSVTNMASESRWWRFGITPSSHRTVTIELPATTSCTDTGAVCTAAGRMLGSSPGRADVWGPRALSVSDATVTEGEGVTLDFDLAISSPPDETLTATYETRNGTATAGSDYTATSGTITFETQSHHKTVSVPVLDDAVAEHEETMTLVVTSLEGPYSLLLDAEGIGTIENDDGPVQPMLSVSDATGSEGDTVSFEVTLDSAPTDSVTTSYATVDGTATSGSDYTATVGSLAFAAGETSNTVTVQILDDDQSEPNETFSLELLTATGAGYADASGTGTIEDDDAVATPTVTFDDQTLPAEHDGSTAFNVDLAFSEEIADIGYAWVRDTLVTATNATVENARRANPPSNLKWKLTIDPDSTADVTLTVVTGLTLPDSRTLTGGDTVTVRTRPAPTATFNDETLPAEHDGRTAFKVDLAFSEEITGIGYAWVRDTLVTATNATVENARRADPPSNLEWELTIDPDGATDVTLTVADGQVLADGRTLTGGDTTTVRGPAPQIASAKGAMIKLTWASPRDHFGTSSGTDWIVSVNGVPRPVASANVAGHRAVLMLSAPVAPGDAVVVGYLGSAMHPLADATGQIRSAPWYGLATENTTGVSSIRYRAPSTRYVPYADPSLVAQDSEVVLNASGAGLTDLQAFARLTSLERMDLSNNQVVDLSPLAELTSLKWLDLSGNRVVDLSPLARLTSLERLDLSRNAVVDLSPVARLTSLRRLDLSGNQVADLWPLVGLDGLERLDLSDNRIEDASPLAGLSRLTVLLLDRNAVDDAWPFAQLAGLENLGLAGNRVAEVTALQALTQLRRLDLRNNPVRDLSPARNIGARMSVVLRGDLVDKTQTVGQLTGLHRVSRSIQDGDRTVDADSGGVQ